VLNSKILKKIAFLTSEPVAYVSNSI